VTNLPALKLQQLVQRAGQTLPAQTGAVAAQQARIDRRRGGAVILADISASMGGPAWGGQRKIDVLRQAVAGAMQQTGAQLVAFSGTPRRVSSVPEPEANTNLAAALRYVKDMDPGVTLVISDGLPDNEAAALAVARTFRGAIDVLYIGPETDTAAIAFMRRLAAEADGNVRTHDVARLGAGQSQQLINHIAGLLT
jgi:hypothetical protein